MCDWYDSPPGQPYAPSFQEVTMTDEMLVTSKTEQAVSRFRDYFTGGTFPPGGQLPSEAELIERFGISRTTVRRALDQLREQGVISTIHGKGSFVNDAKPAHTLARTPNPWDKLEPAAEPHSRKAHANTVTADLFGLEYRTPVYIREQAATHRETGGPVLTARTVAVKPIIHIEPAPEADGDRAHLIAALEAHCGPLATRVRFRYIAKPRAETTADLGLEPGAAIVEVRHLTYGGDGQLLMVEAERTDAATAEWEAGI